VKIEEIAEAISFDLESDQKTVSTPEHRYRAGSIVLATGRVPVHLPIETDWDEHIHYCSVCDGAGYRGKDLVLVGGGNSGFDESLYLTDPGVRSIVIVESMETCLAEASTQKRAFATGKIVAKTNTRVSAIVPTADRDQIIIEDIRSGSSEQITADGVFVFIGQRPNTKMLEGKINLDSSGYIMTDNLMHTNRPGVFAAGDVVAKKYRQLTTAMSDGTIAALETVKYIHECAQP
jgi:thioredoxin reductase (NADPH)